MEAQDRIKEQLGDLDHQDFITFFRDNLNEDDGEYKLIQIDEVFNSFIEALQEKVQRDYRSDLDNVCRHDIASLIGKAVGCRSQCKYCKRKCDLEDGHDPKKYPHSCETMGHGYRVFGGNIIAAD